MNPEKLTSCDIFCVVIDNFGDIGVCWRLAKQLASEHGLKVRLWVDDLSSFSRLCPALDTSQMIQQLGGVEVRQWQASIELLVPLQLVIEAFACELPASYIDVMAAQSHKPVWLNLEYLSAEDWVTGCHGLPSPHSSLPLVKYFFFPGFTSNTGGLLLEKGLLVRRDRFQADTAAQENYWRTLGVSARQAGEIRVSLFSYENPVLLDLLTVWTENSQPITCLVPDGKLLLQLASYLGCQQLSVGEVVLRGSLRIHVLPFVEQEAYDLLLWACDINFVRGEDSFVRAQWAGKPFVWHIYPQHDAVHLKKLQAFLQRYCCDLRPENAQAVSALWSVWNAGEDMGQGAPKDAGLAWSAFVEHSINLQQHAINWAEKISQNNLALNLLDFSRKVGKIAPFEI